MACSQDTTNTNSTLDNNENTDAANTTETNTPSITDEVAKRVLSIQSTVVYGVCGNKSSMFPLQLHGFDVSPINTVQFSNHTGYPKWKGTVTSGKQMDELVDGLQLNNLLTFPYLITGYMGGIDCLSHLNKLIEKLRANLKQTNDSKLFYACDPVMGDNGKLYAPSFEPFIEVYKKDIFPYADLVTPNQTEASFLLNKMQINTLQEAYDACCKFHQQYDIRYVVITSITFEKEPDKIYVVYSDKSKPKTYGYLKIDKIKAYFCGTGDLTTALLFNWIQKHPENLSIAVQKTVATVLSIIQRTQRA
eukprot:CAMPEP_0197045468 /NCGR_PEP_ID=MMETSP1384-20130603/21332_1 /TAXON_ID=29189 /ORGANISM="Ammonia sp." /LENGTH=304 /DNA_ID=CAMNT_0042477091 /DNA_START=8 /DNA_END=919 /DNA_ORIENTATION=-